MELPLLDYGLCHCERRYVGSWVGRDAAALRQSVTGVVNWSEL